MSLITILVKPWPDLLIFGSVHTGTALADDSLVSRFCCVPGCTSVVNRTIHMLPQDWYPQQRAAGSSCCSTHNSRTSTRGQRQQQQKQLDEPAAIPPKRSKKGQHVKAYQQLI
jgi:hypothetical protein